MSVTPQLQGQQQGPQLQGQQQGPQLQGQQQGPQLQGPQQQGPQLQGQQQQQLHPRALSFSSSGVFLVGQMGIYCRLLEAGILDQVTEYYGCSGGALVVFLAALGVTPIWIREWVQHFDTRPLLNIQEEMVVDYMTSWGVDSGDYASEYIRKFIDTWEPGASRWTFAEFAARRPGISLKIIATNVSAGDQEVFSVATHPTMQIGDAIRASSSIPFYAVPWRDSSGQIFCDGAVLESYPLRCVRSPAETLFVICSQPRGLQLVAPVVTFSDYVHKILNLGRFWNRTVEEPDHIIRLSPCGIMMLDFMISKEERLHIFATGISDAERFLSLPRKGSAGGTAESRPLSGGLNALSVSHPSPGLSLDSHRSSIPSPSGVPFQDSHAGGRRRYRRWSY